MSLQGVVLLAVCYDTSSVESAVTLCNHLTTSAGQLFAPIGCLSRPGSVGKVGTPAERNEVVCLHSLVAPAYGVNYRHKRS